jgi:hypothetical protein
VQFWLEPKVKPDTQTFVAVQNLEGDRSHLPNLTRVTEVKKDLDCMMASALEPISND